jgi:rhodanese-related sulfurtransferase
MPIGGNDTGAPSCRTGRDRRVRNPLGRRARPWDPDAMPELTTNPVTAVAPAPSAEAAAHFEDLLAFETDCWDVHEAMRAAEPGFVLLDVRSPELYAEGHVPGAVSLPHARIVERNLTEWPDDTLFVVYCAGPHCNGADRAAVRLARLGRPVKKMIGGLTGWHDEGFTVEVGC